MLRNANNTIELAFELPHLSAVSVHLLAGVAPIFIELVDYECGVTVHDEAFNTELYNYTETMQCRLVLCGIVRCLEVDPKDVAKLFPRWGNKIYACPSTINVQRSIEVHSPVLGMIGRDRGLHIHPLSDEIGEHLQLDRLACPKVDEVGAKFDCPFDDATIGFLVS